MRGMGGNHARTPDRAAFAARWGVGQIIVAILEDLLLTAKFIIRVERRGNVGAHLNRHRLIGLDLVKLIHIRVIPHVQYLAGTLEVSPGIKCHLIRGRFAHRRFSGAWIAFCSVISLRVH